MPSLGVRSPWCHPRRKAREVNSIALSKSLKIGTEVFFKSHLSFQRSHDFGSFGFRNFRRQMKWNCRDGINSNSGLYSPSLSVISSKFIQKFAQKCQYFTLIDQSVPLDNFYLTFHLRTNQFCVQYTYLLNHHMGHNNNHHSLESPLDNCLYHISGQFGSHYFYHNLLDNLDIDLWGYSRNHSSLLYHIVYLQKK